MAHDYAHRPQRSRAQTTPAARFHWVSFVAGVALGSAITVAGATMPAWFAKEATPAASAKVATKPPPVDTATRYEFYERLPRVRVGTDTTPYGEPVAVQKTDEAPATAASAPAASAPGASVPAVASREDDQFVLQAGSFRNREDAERMRVMLEETGFNAITTAVTLGGGATRHRVLVGPFDSEPEVHRALTQLRERDIDALLMSRRAG